MLKRTLGMLAGLALVFASIAAAYCGRVHWRDRCTTWREKYPDAKPLRAEGLGCCAVFPDETVRCDYEGRR